MNALRSFDTWSYLDENCITLLATIGACYTENLSVPWKCRLNNDDNRKNLYVKKKRALLRLVTISALF